MKDLIINERSWLIKTDGRIAVQHTPDQPFATVLKREKTYVTDRGSVKETISVTETSPLTEFEEKGEELILSGSGHELRIFRLYLLKIISLNSSKRTC